MSKTSSDVEQAVRNRYAEAAKKVEHELCCPVSYDPKLLEAIPEEVLTCDYGCGDPTRYLKPGDAVLDLGSGSGKACFLASQIVGPTGKVFGVDMNDEMLDVARRSAPVVARNIGYANVEFRKGKIQNLSLDLELLDRRLKEAPVRSAEGLSALESEIHELRNSRPLIPDSSIDVVVSNCVLNLVRPQDKQQLFTEIFRVLRRGGRAVISDITSDEDIPQELQRNPELWSGCIAGAFREDLFLKAFEEAGFYGVTILERQAEPWRTIEGIEFRSMTVAAYKGKEGPCWDQKHAVIYRGPFRQVEDDDGHVLKRGIRTAVCEKTYRIYSQEPYRSQFELVPPRVPVPVEDATPFPCSSGYFCRDPKETKGEDYLVTTEAQATCCAPGNGNGGCC
ncbi:MAG TPA: methyltransferase domain-containing protein [Terriglobales bacterium]|nr:methyltransferase domain-containing protein [Terriglobales bacterium]